MSLVTWILIGVIVLVAIGLGVGVFFSGLIRGAEIIGQNPTVQNASNEARDYVTDELDTETGRNDMLVVTTNEFTYTKGEPVEITVKNTGDQSLSFPNSALGLEVENVNTGIKYSVVAAEVITDLGPDQSKVITWQDDTAPAGDYIASVHTVASDQSMTAQTTFKITE